MSPYPIKNKGEGVISEKSVQNLSLSMEPLSESQISIIGPRPTTQKRFHPVVLLFLMDDDLAKVKKMGILLPPTLSLEHKNSAR